LIAAQDLRGVRSLDDVIELLAEELDWPLGGASLEEATFDFTPTDLGVPDEQVPQLRRLRQLRPLTAGQPWGVFFLELDGPRLPITPLRRLLRTLVRRKRATTSDRQLYCAGPGSPDTWLVNAAIMPWRAVGACRGPGRGCGSRGVRVASAR
jgi:hypothetical protein